MLSVRKVSDTCACSLSGIILFYFLVVRASDCYLWFWGFVSDHPFRSSNPSVKLPCSHTQPSGCRAQAAHYQSSSTSHAALSWDPGTLLSKLAWEDCYVHRRNFATSYTWCVAYSYCLGLSRSRATHRSQNRLSASYQSELMTQDPLSWSSGWQGTR